MDYRSLPDEQGESQAEEFSGIDQFRDGRYVAAVRSDAGAAPGKFMPTEQMVDLQQVRLSIGDSIQLQDFSNSRQRYYVKLIGFMPRKSVLVSHPTSNEKLCFIKEGYGFLVRGFADTKIYEFTTNVISVCLTPYPFLHLAYPPQVKTINMRGAARVKLKSVCSVESMNTGIKVSATIEDISISGARAHSRKAFGAAGDEISVSFRLEIENENQLLTVRAVIRNLNMENDNLSGEMYVMHGLEFVQFGNIDLLLLQNFIYRRML